MFEAKVKLDYRWYAAQFDGHEYVKGEWRPLPNGREKAAIKSGFLQVREIEKAVPVRVDAPKPPAKKKAG